MLIGKDAMNKYDVIGVVGEGKKLNDNMFTLTTGGFSTNLEI